MSQQTYFTEMPLSSSVTAAYQQIINAKFTTTKIQ